MIAHGPASEGYICIIIVGLRRLRSKVSGPSDYFSRPVACRIKLRAGSVPRVPCKPL